MYRFGGEVGCFGFLSCLVYYSNVAPTAHRRQIIYATLTEWRALPLTNSVQNYIEPNDDEESPIQGSIKYNHQDNERHTLTG